MTQVAIFKCPCVLSLLPSIGEAVCMFIFLYLLSLFPQIWLPAVKAKGLEISGTFSRRQGQMYMDMTFTNKALQHMTDFAIQFNKNR